MLRGPYLARHVGDRPLRAQLFTVGGFTGGRDDRCSARQLDDLFGLVGRLSLLRTSADQSIPLYIAQVMAISVVLTWLYNATGAACS